MTKTYIFIVNPTSGAGRGLKTWTKIKKKLDQMIVQHVTFFTQYNGHAVEITKDLVESGAYNIAAIVAVGGDGTVNEVINGMKMLPHTPFGYIPAGSGNDFARGYQIPRSPLKALSRILSSNIEAIPYHDIGVYSLSNAYGHERYFVNALAIGFDGAVTKEANSSLYKKLLNKIGLGGIGYSVAALKLLFSYQPHTVSISLEGQERQISDVWMIAISNNPFYGGGMKIAPEAKTDDGNLNICVVHGMNRWKILFVFFLVFLGKHSTIKGVSLYEGRNIRLSSKTEMVIAADGEIIGTTPTLVRLEVQSQPVL